MSVMKIDIPEKNLEEFCGRHMVSELSIFGSVVREDFREESDLDILVMFKPEAQIGFLELSRMQRELSEMFGRKVDLVPKRGLKEVIRDEVLSSARVIYAEG